MEPVVELREDDDGTLFVRHEEFGIFSVDERENLRCGMDDLYVMTHTSEGWPDRIEDVEPETRARFDRMTLVAYTAYDDHDGDLAIVCFRERMGENAINYLGVA